MEEGVSHEVSALAGHQQLGNLVLLYDDNDISIEDDTNIAKSEDVLARYAAYGWHTQRVSWRTADGYHEDVAGAVRRADRRARPHRRAVDHRAVHDHRLAGAEQAEHRRGARLGARRRRGRGDQGDPRLRPGREVPCRRRGGREGARGRRPRQGRAGAVGGELRRGRQASPARRALLDRLSAPAAAARLVGRAAGLPADDGPIATRSASGKVLTALAPVLPELWGGSADLAGSNDTTMAGEPSFIPTEHQTRSSPATRTAGPCTSASGSSGWAGSSTGSRCTASPGRTAARSWCSATTCGPRCGWPR